MSGFLVGFRAGDRMHLIASGIQCSRDPLDISALACGIPAFVGDDYRNLLAIQAVMQGIQLLLQMTQFFFIFFLGDLLVQFHLGQLRHLHQREYILQNRHSKALILHGHMDTAAQRLQHL